jgi:transketolase
MEADNKTIQCIANRIRAEVVRMVGPATPGHFGGSFSLAETVATLYFRVMKVDPQNPGWPDRDRLILSKGHAGIVQYAAMAVAGYFPVEELYSLKKLGSRLQGHPDLTKLPGIEANTGSLGQGLSMASGLAAGLRLDGRPSRVFCVVGDGELAEGQIWEAAMAARVHNLDNLTAILDYNTVQAMGTVRERFDTTPYREKWDAFGWNTIEADGHDVQSLTDAFAAAALVKGKPSIVIAHTIKGKGLDYAEGNAAYHNGTLTAEQCEAAIGLFMSRSQ